MPSKTTDDSKLSHDDMELVRAVKTLGKRSKVKKVCIVGGSVSRGDAFSCEPRDEWEIWCVNDIRVEGLTPDRWFALHTKEHFEEHYTIGWAYQKNMYQKSFTPIMVWEKFPDVPDCIVYPMEEVEALTPHGGYHCGSFDWMLALAILEKFEEVRLCGVVLGQGGEPISSRACMEYWIGIAEANGITVDIRRPSDLMMNFFLVGTKNRYGPDKFHLCEDDHGEVLW